MSSSTSNEQSASIVDESRQRVTKRRPEYQKITNSFRRDIIKYWKNNRGTKTMKQIATNMRIPRTTLNSIVKKYKDTGRIDVCKKGGNHNKITDEQLEFIKELVDECPQIALETIQDRLKTQFDLEFPPSISGIDDAINERILYIMEKMDRYPGRRNDPAI